MTGLPLPADTQAVLIGLTNYSSILGNDFNLPCSADDAIKVAAWLHHRGVPVANITLWLAPALDFDRDKKLAVAGLEGCECKDFSREEFDHWMTDTLPQALLASTPRLLFVYWSGHGLVTRRDERTLLVSTNATNNQLRCVDFNNLLSLLKGSNYANFSHQIFVVDACRSSLTSWQPVDEANVLHLNAKEPDLNRRVQQFIMLACGTGQSARQKQEEGSLFTARLLDELGKSAANTWPDFERAFGTARNRVREDTGGEQSPVRWVGQDWDGNRLTGDGFSGISLTEVLNGLGWPLSRFRPNYVRSIPPGALKAPAPDLPTMLAYLESLPCYKGVSPLLEFAERVVRESANAQLETWLRMTVTPNQKAEIAQRLDEESNAPVPVNLFLWYQDRPDVAVMQAELVGADGAIHTGWSGSTRKTLSVTPDNITTVVGQWLDEVYAILGDDVELVIDLCLPRAVLCKGDDLADVSINSGEEKAQLGLDFAVLLRCTDRYKGRMKLKRWLERAPSVLERLGVTPRPLRWACQGDRENDIINDFMSNQDDSPTCLGCDDTPPLAQGGSCPVDIGIENGLPLLCWSRERLSPQERETVERELAELIQNLAQDLPGRLRHWRSRRRGTHAGRISLFFDDPKRLPPMVQQLTQPKG